MAINFSAGSANFMFESPILFGINFQELGGFARGFPLIGGDNSFTSALAEVGNGIADEINSISPILGRYAGIPLSLLVVDSYMAETHTATSTITNDPIESGPNITSHAYPNPASVTIEFVVNDTFFAEFSVGGVVLANAPFIGAVNRVALSYLVLDTIRRSSTPLFLTTRTYIYSSMLIESISVSRDMHFYTRGRFSVTMRQLYQATPDNIVNENNTVRTLEHNVQDIINGGMCSGPNNALEGTFGDNQGTKPPSLHQRNS